MDFQDYVWPNSAWVFTPDVFGFAITLVSAVQPLVQPSDLPLSVTNRVDRFRCIERDANPYA